MLDYTELSVFVKKSRSQIDLYLRPGNRKEQDTKEGAVGGGADTLCRQGG